MDIDAKNLGIIWKLGTRMSRAAGQDLTVTQTTNLEDSIRDSDFVLTTFRTGGLEARVFDEKIPLRHGTIGQETQGPGGFFLALRSMAPLQKIVSAIERFAPGAILLNYSNPVNILVEAVAQHSPVKVIGLCEGPILFTRNVASLCGLDPDTIEVDTVGINHANWSTRAMAEGRDLIPAALDNASRIVANSSLSGSPRRMFRLIQRFRRLPSEYLQYYYFTDEIVAEQRAKTKVRAETLIDGLGRYFDHYLEESEKEKPELRLYRGKVDLGRFTILGDFAVHVLDSIANNHAARFILNVPNRGSTDQFPSGRVVEVPTLVTRKGAESLPAGRIEQELASLLQDLAECQYQTAIAGWRGDRRDAIQALALDPTVRSLQKAENIYSEMAAAHRAYLPERLL